MDLRRLRIGEWLLALAGVALLAVLIANGEFGVSTILLGLLGLAAIATLPLVAGARTAATGITYEVMVLVGGIVGIVVALIGGLWPALVAVLAVCVGSLVAQRDERLSRPGRLTDSTGAPVAAAPQPEHLPAPRA